MWSSPDPIPASDGRPQLLLLLPRKVTAARRARRAVSEMLDDRVTATGLDDIQLVVSELVTNALRHGTGDVVLRADVQGLELHVSVSDTAEEPPDLRPKDPKRIGGLGLHIVDRLSRSWGVAPFPGGKTVWTTMDLPSTR